MERAGPMAEEVRSEEEGGRRGGCCILLSTALLKTEPRTS